MSRYRVWLRSTPGPMAQYDGHVDITLDGEPTAGDIKTRAVQKLRRTSFPDRGPGCWRVTKTELIE